MLKVVSLWIYFFPVVKPNIYLAQVYGAQSDRKETRVNRMCMLAMILVVYTSQNCASHGEKQLKRKAFLIANLFRRCYPPQK